MKQTQMNQGGGPGLKDIFAAIEARYAQMETVAKAAVTALVAIGQDINDALVQLRNGAAPPRKAAPTETAEPVKGPKRRRRRRIGRHPIWHGRISGQFIRPDGKKGCANCFNFYPATTEHFAKTRRTPTGLQSWCKLCHAAYEKGSEECKKRRAPGLHPETAAMERPYPLRGRSVNGERRRPL